LAEFLAFGAVVVLMSNVPLTVAGIGPREYALVELFKTYFDDPATLYLIGLLMSASIHLLPAILGIPLMFPLLRAVVPQSKKTQQSETEERAAAAQIEPALEPVSQDLSGGD
jgi:uncharacterized membrane protein YbhN (UPF0104 family)